MKRISIVAAVLVLGSMMACGRSNDRPAETATSSANVAPKEGAKDGGGGVTPMVPDEGFVSSTDEKDAAVSSARDGGNGIVSTRSTN